MSVSPQNAVRGIACGLIAFSLMLLGFCAWASGMTQAVEYQRLSVRAQKPFDPNDYLYQQYSAEEAGFAISACAYGVGFVFFLVGGIVYGQQDAEVGHKGDANFGVKGQP